ncbi:hypothetical protein AVEN_87982-1 [Araneus ventricosus]|uniref:Tc1-like transposase DDE domain-containing protein n=1 Tax=Araneus ventricosus TaxID=182803 RepID=A0A4Y2LCY8_ARAVE|nr:hypothetical protein AVEN_87982-1 [Araneus ventricosus]
MKEDCSHDDLLFVCFCPQGTSERGCIGPVNIAVGQQSSGTNHSLRMSLDLTSITIPEGNVMARARDTLSGAKHRRKRPLQRWRVTCLGRDNNERPDRPLRVPGCSVTAVRYRDEILQLLERPFITAMGTDAIFMDDNARPHRARLMRSYLESETIPQMAFPPRSPDLNPIEFVCDVLGRRIVGRSVPQAPSTSSNKPYYRNGHYCHNKGSTTLLPACLAIVKHAFQLEGIIPVIRVWFPLHILPANLGCRAAMAVIYVFLFVFALLFDIVAKVFLWVYSANSLIRQIMENECLFTNMQENT